MTTTRIPPLHALHVFETVARHLSMTKAAEELHVTHAAVSQQIKLLEDYLKVSLLKREGKRFTLTPQGKEYATALNNAFSNIKHATERLLAEDDANILTIRVPPTLALRWLVPRLQQFQDLHPNIELRISTTQKEIDFLQESIDIAIYYGDGNWPNLQSDFLFEDYTFPIANPKYFGNKKVTELQETHLRSAKFIYVTYQLREKDWALWTSAANLPEPPKSTRIYFQDTLQALQAAQTGLGIAIAHQPLVMDDIKAGRLVAVSQVKLKLNSNYYLVYPEHYLRKLKVKKFRNWLLKEIKANN